MDTIEYSNPLDMKINPVTKDTYSKSYYYWNDLFHNRVKLPILRKEVYDDLREKIDKSDVLIIESATGSGKTIAISPMLQRIYGYTKKILISQPRTVNIESTADIISKQLDLRIGREIGYQYSGGHKENRNADEVLIHVVTDFFLIKLFNLGPTDKDEDEMSKVNYDIIIVDEVHERKMNMDIFMTAMKMYFKVNRDNVNKKKLILLSATLDVPKFIKYYSDVSIVSHMKVSGRSNPIYSIFLDSEEDNRLKKTMLNLYKRKLSEIIDAILDNRYIDEHLKKCEEGKKGIIKYECNLDLFRSTGIRDSSTGDILIFCPTQSMIDSMYNIYRPKKEYKDIFFTKLSRGTRIDKRQYIAGDPKETYLKDGYTRRVIFSTPIAETGITIVGIKFVIETGIENRVTYSDIMYEKQKKRKRPKQKVAYIDYITQASSTQRCGRSGRKTPGICIRLYSKETYENKFRSIITPEIYDSPLHELVISLLFFTENLDMTKTYISNLPDPINKEDLVDVIDDLYYHGIIHEGKISQKAKAVINLGMDYRLALLIIESFILGLQKFMVPIVAILSCSKNHNISAFIDKDSSEYKTIMTMLNNKWGEPISILKLYKLFSDTFITRNTNLILESHKHIKSYLEDKNEWISTDVILYYERLEIWCKKYGLVFDYMKYVIPTMLKIQKNISKKIGHKSLYIEDEIVDVAMTSDEDEVHNLIISIFMKVFRHNKAGFIPAIKQYVILDTDEYMGIPRSSLLDYSSKPSIIGYTNIIYLANRFPKTGYRPIVSCPYVITWKDV